MLLTTATYAAPAELIANLREKPTLTLYRDGLANLNGEATRLLSKVSDSISLFAPAGPRRRWVLRPATEDLPGEVKLVGRTDRSRHLRFRYPALGLALFAALPESQQALRLVLEPLGTGWQLVAQ